MLNIINSDFTLDEIMNVLSSLKHNKAAGIDGLPAEFYVTLKDF